MKSALLLIFTFMFLPLLVSCSSTAHSENAPDKKEEKKEAKPTNVKVSQVTLTTLTEYVSLSAQTDADKDVTFCAENPGRLEYLSVDVGSRVKKGQTIARINTEILKAQLDQATAGLELAQKTFDRINSLKEQELASQQQFDEAQTNLFSAKAAEALARAQFRKSVVRSSIDGIVAQKQAEVGEYLNPGQPIMQIVNYKTIVVKAQVPETLVGIVKKEMPVKVTIESLGKTIDGTVHVVIPAAHWESKTFELRVNLPNDDYEILVGMSATVKIISEVHEQAVVASQETVVEEKNVRVVYIDDDGVARRREVELGATEGANVLVTAGLSAGDKLIIEGQRTLMDGQPIHVVVD